eukprot:COSAG01_NODE_4007_length_5440_cov_3.804531_4_plen_65_part_00
MPKRQLVLGGQARLAVESTQLLGGGVCVAGRAKLSMSGVALGRSNVGGGGGGGGGDDDGAVTEP